MFAPKHPGKQRILLFGIFRFCLQRAFRVCTYRGLRAIRLDAQGLGR